MIEFITLDHWIEDLSFNIKARRTALRHREDFSTDSFGNIHLTLTIL